MIPLAVKNIADEIAKTVDASKIYLFGSYARGTQDERSDYDFFIVLPDGSIRPMEAMQKIYMALSAFPMKVPVDVIASCENDFEERKTLVSSLERTVQSEGILLYERA